MNNRWTDILAGAFTVLCLVGGASALAQDGGGGEQTRFLQVRRSQIDLKEARAKLSRTQELFHQGLVPKTELEQMESTVEKMQLAYQEALLSLLSLQPRLSVKSAIKMQSPDGRKLVRLTVTNLSPTFDDSQFRLLNNFEGADPIPAALKTRAVHDVFISLKEPGSAGSGGSGGGGSTPSGPPRGTTIGLPYEVHIPNLPYGQSKTLEFELLRDVTSLVVATSYKGQQREIDVQLQQADTANAVTLTSTQISQEADLAGSATFDLRLERSTVDSRSFQLRALNLPRQLAASFLDPGTQARLSQINFPAGVTQQTLSLRLFLPERGDAQVQVDHPLAFWAVVMSPEQAPAFAQDRPYTDDEIREHHVGQVRLELIPRGVGKIEVAASSLYSEIVRGAQVRTRLTVRNTGTRRLDNVQLVAEPPFNWRVELVPPVIPALDLNQERPVELRILPPDDVAVGDYEVRIKTESSAYNRKVPTEEKIYRVSVAAKSNVWTTLGIVGTLLALVGGVVFAGVKLTRR